MYRSVMWKFPWICEIFPEKKIGRIRFHTQKVFSFLRLRCHPALELITYSRELVWLTEGLVGDKLELSSLRKDHTFVGVSVYYSVLWSLKIGLEHLKLPKEHSHLAFRVVLLCLAAVHYLATVLLLAIIETFMNKFEPVGPCCGML